MEDLLSSIQQCKFATVDKASEIGKVVAQQISADVRNYVIWEGKCRGMRTCEAESSFKDILTFIISQLRKFRGYDLKSFSIWWHKVARDKVTQSMGAIDESRARPMDAADVLPLIESVAISARSTPFENYSECLDLLRNATNPQDRILWLRYMFLWDLNEIADHYGISPEQVTERIAQCLKDQGERFPKVPKLSGSVPQW